MKLPIVLKIKEDEILYSYLLRLSHANGFDDLRDFFNMTGILPMYTDSKYVYRTVRYDIHSDLYPLIEALDLPLTEVAELYLQTSLFPIVSLTCSRAISSHRIGMLSRYRNRTSLITPLSDTFQGLKFCPACKDQDLEERGEFYYRRSHQIPGVCVCHRHGCALHIYQGKKGLEMYAGQESKELPVLSHSIEYAWFCHDLLHADLQADITDIATAVYVRMKELGFTKQTAALLQEYMGPYAALINIPLKTFFRYFPSKSQCDLQTCFTVLLFLFGDVNTLQSYLSTEKKKSGYFDALIDGKYELRSPWRENLIELYCRTCQKLFLTTPKRIQSGWGCPTCDDRLTDQDLFQRLFNVAACDDYDLLSFAGMKNPVTIRHRACGREYAIRPRSFLEENVRCPCNKTASVEEACRRIASAGDFELISFQRADLPMELLHITCGYKFLQKYSRFIRHPNCKHCASLSLSEESFRQNIYNLVGEEYELVGPYTDRKIGVQIRHNICNTVQIYKPWRFLSGTRCSKCHQRLEFFDFSRIVDEVSYGVYTVDKKIGKYNALIRNTRTGELRKLPIVRVIQELFRFTPSAILPLEERNLNVKPTSMIGRRVLAWLSKHYPSGKSFSLKQIDFPGMEHQQLSKTIQNLYRANKLKRIGYGVYIIPSTEGEIECQK